MAAPSLLLIPLPLIPFLAMVAAGLIILLLRAILLGAKAMVPRLARFADKGWELHCRKCGWKHDALKQGIVRIGAVSRGKRILGRCGGCGKWGWLALERTGPR